MSFDLGVFYTESPVTDQSAMERYAAYCEEDDLTPYIEPSPRVAAFVKELTDQHPQIDDMPEEELESCPWSVAFDVSKGHVLMCMTYFWAPDMTDLITDLAKKHGLVCVCPQSGEILTAPAKLLSGPEAKRLAKPSTARTSTWKRPSLAAVISEVSRSLADLGFVSRGKDEFTWDVNDEVVAYVGLNGRESRNQTELEPTIGLRHHQLMELVRQFDNSKVYTAVPLTYSTALRTVTPRRSITPQGHIGLWRFSDGEGQTIAADIVAEIKTHAIPFFEARGTLDALVTEVLARCRGPFEPAAGLYLLKRYDEALLYLEAQLNETAGDEGSHSKRFRGFARELIGRMKADGLTVPPGRQELLESLTATPQRSREEGEAPYFREQPFVVLFDELLLAEGFRRTDLVWRKVGRRARITLTLQPGLIDVIYVEIDFKVFCTIDAATSDQDPIEQSLFLLRLSQICSEPVALKLKRALCFYHDYATSGVFEHDTGLTEKRAMEPEVPLSMEWRVATLREAVTDHALPLFRRLENSLLARLKWNALSAIFGFDLGDRKI